jgi:succinoglycan biosynthesis protein ExoA
MTEVTNAKVCSEAPLISVLIPVLNEDRHLERLLEVLTCQTYPEDLLEILVIDGGSTDATVEIAETWAASSKMITVLENPGRWSSRGRNVGVRASKGRYVVVIDGHCELRDSEYVAKVADLFETSGADSLGRPQPLAAESASAIQQAIAIARASPLGHHADSWIYSRGERFVPAISVAAAFKRSVFSTVGLFDESFEACEDVEFNYRLDQAGLSCYFSDRLSLAYVPRRSLLELSKQMIRYGRGRIRLLRKYPATFSIKSLAPGLFIASAIVGVALSTISDLVSAIVIGVVGLYVMLILLAAAWVAPKAKRWLVLPLVPFQASCVWRTVVQSEQSGSSVSIPECAIWEPGHLDVEWDRQWW